jgi:uncharacterized cupredoxin-like copper-binding protein
MRSVTIATMLAVVLTMTACGGDHSEHEAAPGLGALGHAADPDEADREIEIEALDSLGFSPANIEVKVDEVVTFVITNSGEAVHEFVIGDEQAQMDHADHMESEGGGGMIHDEPNAVSLEAGETKEITWYFTDEGTTLIGCHEPGHYDGGMKGTISVSS